MFRALVDAFKFIAKKPWILLPALALYLLSLAAFLVFYEQLMYVAFEQLVIEGIPEIMLWQLPLVLLQRNFSNALLFGALALGGIFTSNLAALFYAKHAFSLGEKIGSMKEDIYFALGKWKEALALSLVFACIAFIYFFLCYAVLAFLSFNPLLAFALVALFSLLLLYVLFSVFLFSVPVLAIEGLNVKEALQNSWEFSSKHFFGVLAFVVIVWVIGTAIHIIGLFVSQQPEIDAEDLFYAITVLFFNSLVFAFTALALSLYYIENRGPKPERKAKRHVRKRKK